MNLKNNDKAESRPQGHGFWFGFVTAFLTFAGHLAAQDQAPFFTVHPTNAVVDASQSIQLSAEAGGTPAPVLQWQLNGTDLPGNTASTLTLQNLHTNQSGTYRLMASNSVGVAFSDQALLTVLPVLPTILTHPTNVTVFEGQRASFTVSVITANVPTYLQWQHEYSDLPSYNAPWISGAQTPTLSLPFAGLTNAGDYSVIVSNLYGAVTSQVATLTVNEVPMDAGWLDTSFAEGSQADGQIRTVAIQKDGRILIGGAFASFNGVSRNRIARLHEDGSVDLSFDPGNGPNGEILAIGEQENGKIVIGGQFTAISGLPRNYLARLNSNGSLDFSFEPDLPISADVLTLKILPDDKILHAGALLGLGRRNPNGSQDTAFANFTQEYTGGTVPYRVLATDGDGKILLGTQYHLFRRQPSGAIDSSFSAPILSLGANVTTAALTRDNKILFGGGFIAVNLQTRIGIACLNPDGTLSSAFSTVFTNAARVRTLAITPDGKVVIAGTFSTISGVATRGGIARLNSDGSIDTTFDTSSVWSYTDNSALAVRDNGKIVIGGSFSRAGGLPRSNLAQVYGDKPAPPKILTHPVSQTVEAGRKTSLSVSVNSPPVPSYQWKFNGTDLGTATNQTLHLPDIEPTQAGNFTVVISNVFGMATSMVATVTVVASSTNAGATDITFGNGFGADGLVYCSTPTHDGKILIGGLFTHVHGVPRPCVARLLEDGTLDETFDPGSMQLGLPTVFSVGKGVLSLASAGGGKVYVGGTFTNIAGVPRSGLARLNADGSLDPSFDPGTGANDIVVRLAVQPDGKVLIAGAFTTVNGINRGKLARLDHNGRVDSNFVPSTQGSTVSDLELQANGSIIAAGEFSASGRAHIVRFKPDGTVDSTFNLGVVTDNAPQAIASDPNTGRIYLACGRIACLNSNGSVVATFNPNITYSGTVRSLAVDSARRLLVGSSSTNFNGVRRTHLARVNPDGNLDQAFNAVLDGTVWSVSPQLHDDTTLITGEFSFANGARRRGFARLLGDPVLPPAITNQPIGRTLATGQALTLSVGVTRPPEPSVQWFRNGVPVFGATNDQLYLLHALTTHSGNYFVVVSNILGVVTSSVVTVTVAPPVLTPARINFDFTPVPGPDAPVRAMFTQLDGKLIIAGEFTNVHGIPRQRVARLNQDGSLDPIFASNLAGFDSWYRPAVVKAIAQQPDGKIILGGLFVRYVENQSRWCLERLNRDGTHDLSFNAGFSGDADTRAILVEPNGDLILGKAGYGGMVRLRGTNGARDLTFVAKPDESVFALQRQSDGRIIAGGAFTSVDGKPRNRIARFLPHGALDETFNPGIGADAPVNALAIQLDGKIAIGGLFTNVAGAVRARIARLNSDGSLDESFDPGLGANGPINALAVMPNGLIYLAGAFTSVNGISRPRVARLRNDGSLDPEFNPGLGADAIIYALELTPGGSLYLGGAFRLFSGLERNRVIRLNGDVTASEPHFSEAGFSVSFDTITGRTYWLEFSDSLEAPLWTTLASVAGNGATQALTAPASDLNGFYRVRVE